MAGGLKFVSVVFLAVAAVAGGAQVTPAKKKPTTHHSTTAKKAPTSSKAKKLTHNVSASPRTKSSTVHHSSRTESSRSSRRHHVVEAKRSAKSIKLHAAFVASSQLRPMAQQLLTNRTVAAYSGVQSYASSHVGEASAAAYLALGHAYATDHRYSEAQSAFRNASQRGESLADYADYLGAQAALNGGQSAAAVALLQNFSGRYPDSLFAPTAPVLLSQAYLAMGNNAAALKVLQPLLSTAEASHTDFKLALGKAYQASGDAAHAAEIYRGLYLGYPLSSEAEAARKQLATINIELTPAERKRHADAMFNAKHFEEAQKEYLALRKDQDTLTPADRDALEIYAAVCDLRLKKLTRADVEHLPVTNDDSAALKMYLQSEYARNEGDTAEHDRLVQQIANQFPQSRWLEEALYSGGNMYLVKHDQEHALENYTQLFTLFPHSTYAPSAHWHAAWLSYRLHRFPDAARLMDQQIQSYPAGDEVPGALYWRGRLYEDAEHKPGQATNYYKALNAAYVNSYYAIMGRVRLAALGNQPQVDPAPALSFVRALNDPHLTDVLPEDDDHLITARLLANAALNEYIRPEIQLSSTSPSWGALAIAQIYQSFGEDTRALQTMKHSGLPFFSLPVSEVPMIYWQLEFPRPYWEQIRADSAAVGVDPFLTASLIRQESEFNAGAVSRADAYGLMQLLPSTGKMWAKKRGIKHFKTTELLNPTVNLELGTADLKSTIDRFGGTVEYALAAYNAGDGPVRTWLSSNDYKDVPEWVESIPYTETRNYVQGIIRNREMYRAIYAGK